MYEPQIQENHNIICKQCSTVNSIYSQCLNTFICEQCGKFHNLSSQCPLKEYIYVYDVLNINFKYQNNLANLCIYKSYTERKANFICYTNKKNIVDLD